MNKMKILLIGDTQEQRDIFKEAVEAFNKKSDLEVKCAFAEDVAEVLDQIDGSYDGGIIDMRLGGADGGGNEIVRQLHEASVTLPLIFLTADLDLVEKHLLIIKKRCRDEGTYESDLLLFEERYKDVRTHNETLQTYTAKKLATAASIQRMREKLGITNIKLEPLSELRKSMERSGIRPEDNEFSRAIIAAREE